MMCGAATRSLAQPACEYDFVPSIGNIVSGPCTIYLDVPNGTNGTSANVLSWNLNGDGLNFTPNNSTVSGTIFYWDNNFLAPGSLIFTAMTNYVHSGSFSELQYLHVVEHFPNISSQLSEIQDNG